MIKSALIAVGLSVSGLGAGVVPEDAPVGVSAPREAGSTTSPIEPVASPKDVAAATVEDTPTPAAAAPNRTCTDVGPVNSRIAVIFAVGGGPERGLQPFHRDVAAHEVMDGSDPSADFCP